MLALIDEQPELTLDEVVGPMRKHRVSSSRKAVWRFFQPKKALRAAEQERAEVARARRRWMREQGMLKAAAKLLTRDEARRIAANMAKLPELLSKPKSE